MCRDGVSEREVGWAGSGPTLEVGRLSLHPLTPSLAVVEGSRSGGQFEGNSLNGGDGPGIPKLPPLVGGEKKSKKRKNILTPICLRI